MKENREFVDKLRLANGAFRMLMVLEALSSGDKDKNEIKEWVQKKCGYEMASDETLKLDISTLKSLGYEINRVRKGGKPRFHLENEICMQHFSLEDYTILDMVKNACLTFANYDEILKLKNFYKTLLPYTDKKFHRSLMDFGYWNYANRAVIQMLYKCVQKEQFCTLTYTSSLDYKKTIHMLPLSIFARRKRMYIKCYSKEHRNIVSIRLDKIISARKVDIGFPLRSNRLGHDVTYTAHYTKRYKDPIEEHEKVVSKNKAGNYKVELRGNSEFDAVQKVLSLGKGCLDIEEREVIEQVLKHLDEVWNMYNEQNA